MGSLRLVTIALLLGSPAFAQSHIWRGTHSNPGRNQPPWISRSVLRERNSLRAAAPPRRAQHSFSRRVASAAMAKRAQGRAGARAAIEKRPRCPHLGTGGRILPLTAPFATTVWDYHPSRHACRE